MSMDPQALVWVGAGAFLGAVVAMLLGHLTGSSLLRRARREAAQTITDAQREAATIEKEARTSLKEEKMELRGQIDQEIRERRKELSAIEKRLLSREETVEQRLEAVEKRSNENDTKEQSLADKSKALQQKHERLDKLTAEQITVLERASGLSIQDARDLLIEKLESEVRRDVAKRLKRVEDELVETAEGKAKKILSEAIQRCASDHVAEHSISVVNLENDDLKGRIIGREGRNIRALEHATGVNVIIDDTPEAVILSGFDPVRREVARLSLERLVQDGRIHPARIEEIVEKVKNEMEQTLKDLGREACLEVDVHGLHPEIVRMLGRLNYRTSYGQNVLRHSQEVCHLAGIMAAELRIDVTQAKRAGLIHDIGKAMTHEMEGSHAVNGYDYVKKYGESELVANAVGAHHNEMPMNSIVAVLVQAADALSAARPGARREMVEAYVKRLEQLEEIANAFDGVEKSYALQAGREIRVVVEPEKIDDAEAAALAREVAKKVEEELTYPGEIRVTVVRETRAVETAK